MSDGYHSCTSCEAGVEAEPCCGVSDTHHVAQRVGDLIGTKDLWVWAVRLARQRSLRSELSPQGSRRESTRKTTFSISDADEPVWNRPAIIQFIEKSTNHIVPPPTSL